VQAAQERLLDLAFAMLRRRWRWPVRYGIAVATTLAVAALKFVVPAFGAPGPDVFLTVPVAVAAILAGFGPALVATIGTTLLAAWFTPPAGFVWGANGIDVIGFFVEGLIVALLGAGVRGAFERTADNLRRREELEHERSALIATVNHELRNPLASLSGHLQLAARYAARDDLRERVPRALTEANQQVTRLLRLADDLVVISRSADEAFQVENETVDLAGAVEAAARRVGGLDPNRTITVALPATPVAVSADPTRLDQILDNLLRNAASYSERSAPVELEASVEKGRGVVRVRDHGRGIDPADRERIFERFGRGGDNTEVPGMGLGLYVSRELATRMGGDLQLAESSSAGSVFALSLVLIESAPEVPTTEEASAAL
jgi:signal transduction histidine kinase